MALLVSDVKKKKKYLLFVVILVPFSIIHHPLKILHTIGVNRSEDYRSQPGMMELHTLSSSH